MKKSITDATFSLCLCSKTMWTAILKTVDVTRNNAVLGDFSCKYKIFQKWSFSIYIVILCSSAWHCSQVKDKENSNQMTWQNTNGMRKPNATAWPKETGQTDRLADWHSDRLTQWQPHWTTNVLCIPSSHLDTEKCGIVGAPCFFSWLRDSSLCFFRQQHHHYGTEKSHSCSVAQGSAG